MWRRFVNAGPIPDDWDSTADHFASLADRRRLRDRVRIAFLEKAKRTSRIHRRWFRIAEIEPDANARQELIDQWRASIHSGDLQLKGKSQVLCLSASPLLEGYRLAPELARGEHFNLIVDDLWMSARRWLEWFRQVGIEPPLWMTRPLPQWLERFHEVGRPPPGWLLSAINDLYGKHDLPVALTVRLVGAPSTQPTQPENRRGRPPLNWSPVRTLVFELMNHHGEFDPADEEWNVQARLEEKVSEFFEEQNLHPAESTIRSHVVTFLSEWRAQYAPNC
jgi:hypothetical protein